VLFSLEVAATLLLFGAQVISEYERIDKGATLRSSRPPPPPRIEEPPVG
jgi:hypothetical protein